MKSTPLVLCMILCLCSKYAEGQFSENFEFLEHRHVECQPGALKVHNKNQIYYASHNAAKPMTLVNRVTSDKEFEVLLKFEFTTAQSKLFVESDSSFQIVLYSLWEYDIPGSGFYVVNVDGSEISIDTVSYEKLEERTSLRVTNIEKDQNGDWIFFDQDSTYVFDKNGVKDAAPKQNTNFIRSSFRNAEGQLFINWYDNNENENLLQEYVNGEFVTRYTFPGSAKVTNLLNYQGGNLFAQDNQILLLSSDCTTLQSSWEPDEISGEIRTAKLEGNQVKLLTNGDEHYFLYTLDNQGTWVLEHEAVLGEGEEMYTFDNLGEDQYLLTGTYNIEDITDNVFFRNTNLVDNSNVFYPKISLRLDDVEVSRSLIDTFEIRFNGDTAFYQTYSYDFSIDMTNFNFEDYHVANVFSEDFVPVGFADFKFYLGIETDSFPATSTITIDTTISNRWISFDEVIMAAPGANYMFNNDPNNVIRVSVLTSVEDVNVSDLISFYPNPALNTINIEVEEEIEYLSVYTLEGQLMYYTTKDLKTIDVSNYSAGSYLLSLRKKGQKESLFTKFIKI